MTTQRKRARHDSGVAVVPVVPVDSTSIENPSSPEARDREIVALRQELASLRAEFAAFRTTMITPPAIAPVTIEEASEATAEVVETPHSTSTSRRSLLKWGGLGAAAALAAAGGTALSTPTAHASNGASLVLGSSGNTAESNTKITLDNTAAGIYGFIIDTEQSPQSTGLWAISGDGGFAVRARVQGNHGAAVKAEVTGTGGTGVWASVSTGGYGVYGVAGTNGYGVYGYAVGDAAIGVLGQSDSGVGVFASSDTGTSLLVGGTGRINQFSWGGSGAPATGSHSQGEQVRDNKGDLYLCVTSGTPGTWRKVAAGIPGSSGAINFLANPIRLLDTRSGLGTSSTAPWNGGSTHALQVTGVTIGGISVPTGAIGVVGNITVLYPTGAGYLRVYPGPTVPKTGAINFLTGWSISNGLTSRLNSSGQFTIAVGMPAGTHAHILFDVTSYIL